MAEEKGTIVLVGFYNIKALGVRYLEAALKRSGWRVATIFYKNFNSVNPKPTTQREVELFIERVRKEKPVLVGLSVMSSMYLETVDKLVAALQKEGVTIACGGAYATMFPDYFLDRGVEYVIRTDGEIPLPLLAEAVKRGERVDEIPSLCWMQDGQKKETPITGIEKDIDKYGLPAIRCENACYIENDALQEGDPQLQTRSYEVIASRGCPFTCSYCCCINLRRLLPKGAGVRTRSVESVMEELNEAKKHCKQLVFILFYEEIFPNLPVWVDEFCRRYPQEINMPFTIWSHPKMVNADMLAKLRKVGLTEVIMGIQSGSDHIRHDVFHRYETQEDIIEATRVIAESGVFWASYDFMVQHPFESTEDLRQSYELVKKMHGRFELQLHGLNFLPGTDIVPMAIEAGYFTEEEMEKVMYAPMDDQFGAYWQRTGDRENMLWYEMTYCLQFSGLREKVIRCEENPLAHADAIDRMYRKAQRMAKLRYYYKKARVVLKSKVRLG